MVNIVLAILVKAWDTINDSEKDEEARRRNFSTYLCMPGTSPNPELSTPSIRT